MMYLTLYVIALMAVVMLAWPVKHLRFLTMAFIANAMFFMALPVTTGHYLIAGLADLVMALLCVRLWCFASRRIAQLALLGMAINLCMYGWYHHPTPYDAFMVAYNWYPWAIKGIEIMQLLLLLYWVPAVQRLAGRLDSAPKKGEPPCQFSIAHR